MGYYLITVFFAAVFAVYAYHDDRMDDISAFEHVCSANGGVVLSGYKGGSGSIGCYRVEDIYTEVEK